MAKVTMKGNPVTLVGQEPAVGAKVDDFEVVGEDLGAVRFSSFKAPVRVIVTVPSLDTPVCDIEVRRFNQEAAVFGDKVAVLVASMDLPFAQKRWCGAAEANNVVILSDHRDGSCGKALGVLIEGLRLLSRAVFVVDADGVLRYSQIVSEIANEPDYEAALQAVRKLTSG